MASIGAYIEVVAPSSSGRFAHDGADLHYETWEPAAAASATLYHVHGVCESNETVTVQRLAKGASERGIRFVGLELEGHGLSGGPRGVCGDFDRLFVAFAAFVEARVAATAASPRAGGAFAVSGHSLGASVCAYAAAVRGLSRHPRFLGAILLGPAVGLNARAVPPLALIPLLRLASYLAPESSFGLTPLEDPGAYEAPPGSARNFRGNWPLATSRMLLDVTSRRCAADLASGALVVDFPVLVIHGRKDRVVPLSSVRRFRDAAGLPDSALMAIPLAGHDLCVDPATGKNVVARAVAWLEHRVAGVSAAGDSAAPPPAAAAPGSD